MPRRRPVLLISRPGAPQSDYGTVLLTFRTLEFLFEPVGVEALAGSLAPKTA